MTTKQLGNSDMNITPLGVGAWAIGGGGWAFALAPTPAQLLDIREKGFVHGVSPL